MKRARLRVPFVASLVGPIAAAVLAAGCAAFAPPDLRPGLGEAEVLARMGTPTARHAMPAGTTRLEFATGPYGRTTWMVDLDAAGRLVAAEQVLTEDFLSRFQARAEGMTADELRRTLGTPGERRGAGWVGGETWSWRYVTNDCLWFQVSLGRDGRVTGSGFAIDPICDAPSDRD